MNNDTRIKIVEKPDWVSWDEIHEVVWEAHANNREKGIIMSYPSLSGEEIKNMIGDHGKMFLAVEDNKVVGTLALIVVLPEYSGKGIYRSLYQLAESTAKQMNLSVLTRDTNERNVRMLKITKQEGYHFVEYRAHKDHCSIVKAKWLETCPFTDKQIKRHFVISKLLTKIQYKSGKVERSRLLSFLCKAINRIFNG